MTQGCSFFFLASSKIFLTTFAASLAAELAESKIDVLVVVSIYVDVTICDTHLIHVN